MSQPLVTPETAAAGEAELFDAFREGVGLQIEIQNMNPNLGLRDVAMTLRAREHLEDPNWIYSDEAAEMARDALLLYNDKAIHLDKTERLHRLSDSAAELFVGRSVIVTPLDERDTPIDRYALTTDGDYRKTYAYAAPPRKVVGEVLGVDVAKGMLKVTPRSRTRETILHPSYNYLGVTVFNGLTEPRVHVNFTD